MERESGTIIKKGQYFTAQTAVDKNGQPLPTAVAMIVKCVSICRRRTLALGTPAIKTIYLCPVYYNQVDYWARKRATEEQGDLKFEQLTFDGVNIEMMDEHHVIRSQYGNDEFDYSYYEPEVKTKEIN